MRRLLLPGCLALAGMALLQLLEQNRRDRKEIHELRERLGLNKKTDPLPRYGTDFRLN